MAQQLPPTLPTPDVRGPASAHRLPCPRLPQPSRLQCGTQQQLRRALELVAEMRSRGVQCNVHTYSALMNVCIKGEAGQAGGWMDGWVGYSSGLESY